MDKNPRRLFGIIEEMRRVTFPTRQQTIKLTLTVLLISLIVALYLGIIDLFLAKILEIITKTK